MGSFKKIKNNNNIKLVEGKVYMSDDYDDSQFYESYHGLNIPTKSEYIKEHGYDAKPVDRNLLFNSKDPKLRNDPEELIFHRVKFTQPQWDFLLEQASQDMNIRLKEIYADMILREGEFKFKVGKVKYLGPGKPGNCGEPSCNRRIGTAYYLEPVDPSRKDLGDYPEYVGSTCITHIAGIDPRTAMEIKRMEQDAKGERDSIAEKLEKYGDFDTYMEKTGLADMILMLNDISNEEIDEYNRRYNYSEKDKRRLTKEKLDDQMALANEFLQNRLPLKESLELKIHRVNYALKYQRGEAYKKEKYKKEMFIEEQKRKQAQSEYQQKQEAKIKKEQYYEEFCKDYLNQNPNNYFVKSLLSQITRGRGLTVNQETALVKMIKQKSGIFSGEVNVDEANKQLDQLKKVVEKVDKLAKSKKDKGLENYINYLHQTLMVKLEKGIPIQEEEELKHFNRALRWIKSGKK